MGVEVSFVGDEGLGEDDQAEGQAEMTDVWWRWFSCGLGGFSVA